MQRTRTTRTLLLALPALVAALFLAACESADKAPAEAAIKAAEAALAPVKAEAGQYVPDQVKAAEDALQSARASFDKKEYKAALAGAQAIPAKAQEIGAAVAAKKAELTKTWESMSEGLPKMAEAIKKRVDILSQSRRLPAGLDKAKLDGAKAGLAALNQGWEEASAAFKAGSLADAVAKAEGAKAKAVEVMTALNMPIPAAAK
jgi:hypothetical protein